jgi:biotin-dependent carboxylase-like uncharacterized protein
MKAALRLDRVAPLTTIQDGGRNNMLAHGISASGPMDYAAWDRAGRRAGAPDGAAIELTRAGLEATLTEGRLLLAWDGGVFEVRINGALLHWPGAAELTAGDTLTITPGPEGNYGYLRFGAQLQVRKVLGSVSTSTRAGIGGVEGRMLRAGDILAFAGEGAVATVLPGQPAQSGPIRFIWGLHAERFAASLRDAFVTARFRISPVMDRMGVQLADLDSVFAGQSILSLVSDPVLPGDIQILGDGTPIVLMRDHQPTGGYPRIGTVISADLDRFAQLRPGSEVTFEPVTVAHAHAILRSGQ